jgi:hypothetical protein
MIPSKPPQNDYFSNEENSKISNCKSLATFQLFFSVYFERGLV